MINFTTCSYNAIVDTSKQKSKTIKNGLLKSNHEVTQRYKILSKKYGHMSIDESIEYSKLNQQLGTDTVITGTSMPEHIGDYDEQPIEGADRASILRTPGDKGSVYDEGYNIDVPLNQYREDNERHAYNNALSIVVDVLLVISIIVSLIFLLRFIIRRWSIIRKFFTG